MMIHEISNKVPRHKQRKRVGRGHGSGVGKTSGRGHKGAGSRAGFSRRPAFEGGQMPLLRRLPKRGFSNFNFRKEFTVVNVAALEERFESGATVDLAAVVEAGLASDASRPLKVLGHGALTKSLTITAGKVSASAKAKIEAAGGSITLEERKKWTRDRTVKTARQRREEAKQTKATQASETTEGTE